MAIAAEKRRCLQVFSSAAALTNSLKCVYSPDFPYQEALISGTYGKVASKSPVFSFAAKAWLEEPNGCKGSATGKHGRRRSYGVHDHRRQK